MWDILACLSLLPTPYAHVAIQTPASSCNGSIPASHGLGISDGVRSRQPIAEDALFDVTRAGGFLLGVPATQSGRQHDQRSEATKSKRKAPSTDRRLHPSISKSPLAFQVQCSSGYVVADNTHSERSYADWRHGPGCDADHQSYPMSW